jgi:membrane protein
MKISNYYSLLKEAFKNAGKRKAFRNSTVLSYYTIFSLPGLLVIIINVAGIIFGEEAVKNKISSQISSVVGSDTAASVQEMIANASSNPGVGIANLIGTVMLVLGATGVLLQLKEIMNEIWGVQPGKGSKLIKILKDRASSIGMILIVGFLLLVSLVLSAGISMMSEWIGQQLGPLMTYVFILLDVVVSVALIGLLFAAIFKVVPDVKLKWRDVAPGAVVTAVMFVIAKVALGIYFSKTDPGSTYGAAGSVVLIMLWVTYSAFILLLGAEFVKVYVDSKQIGVEAKNGALLKSPPTTGPMKNRTRASVSRSGVGRKDVNTSQDSYHYEAP